MKKYWIITAVAIMVIGASLLIFLNKDKKDTTTGGQKAEETVHRTNHVYQVGGGVNPTALDDLLKQNNEERELHFNKRGSFL
ncbi:hypothetical protein F4694_002683 [Bacillus niacini]|uniref:Uncharacterized protein n=1 Tax=Neobacillus niacini TaxID=86668 RepID=A0A852TEZ4_9BACI|nr:hypothetical protein [Neobacillus niacini]NYE05908.1 hypothetical protein [Neobacillus niacini]